MKNKNERTATVRTTSEVRPKRPKVDRGAAFEPHVRNMFVLTVDQWVKDNIEPEAKPTKDQIGNVVDNLTAQFQSAIETLVDAATDSYLSTTGEEDVEIVECPHCEEEVELPEDYEEGEKVVCTSCKKKFVPEPDDDDDDDDGDSGEGMAVG